MGLPKGYQEEKDKAATKSSPKEDEKIAVKLVHEPSETEKLTSPHSLYQI